MNEATNGTQVVSAQDLDQYGRSEAERTTLLSSDQAEAINVEVEDGQHTTYTDALEYVIQRGLAEIKRTRIAQNKTRQAKLKANAMDKLSDLLSLNPTLVNQPEAMAKVFAQLGLSKH